MPNKERWPPPNRRKMPCRNAVRAAAESMSKPTQPSPRVRVKLAVRGAVQGVGFRPFIHRLATEMALAGWVNNSPQGVVVEVESPRATLEQFLHRLEIEAPPHCRIHSLETTWLDAVGLELPQALPPPPADSLAAAATPLRGAVGLELEDKRATAREKNRLAQRRYR